MIKEGSRCAPVFDVLNTSGPRVHCRAPAPPGGTSIKAAAHITELPEAVSLTDTQKRELDRRLDSYHKNPNAGSPWEEVRKRIQKRA